MSEIDLSRRDPVISGDQRAGDDDREEHRRQQQPQDVAGAPGQRLQQAARNGDFPPVDSHADQLTRTCSAAVHDIPQRRIRRRTGVRTLPVDGSAGHPGAIYAREHLDKRSRLRLPIVVLGL